MFFGVSVLVSFFVSSVVVVFSCSFASVVSSSDEFSNSMMSCLNGGPDNDFLGFCCFRGVFGCFSFCL